MPMTQERAKYLVKNMNPFGELKRYPTHPDGIREEEEFTVRTVWSEMDGNTSFMDALYKIARGENE